MNILQSINRRGSIEDYSVAQLWQSGREFETPPSSPAKADRGNLIGINSWILLQECKTSAKVLDRLLRRKASECGLSLTGTLCTTSPGCQIRCQRDKPCGGELPYHVADAIIQALVVMNYNNGRALSLGLRFCQEGAYIRPA